MLSSGVGVATGLGVASGVLTGVGLAVGEGEGEAFAFARRRVRRCVFVLCFEPDVSFFTVLSVAWTPCLSVSPVAFAPFSIVFPVFVAPFSKVRPVFSTGPELSAASVAATGSPAANPRVKTKRLIIDD